MSVADNVIADLRAHLAKQGITPAPIRGASTLTFTSGMPKSFAGEVIYEREAINDFLCRGETTIILGQPATGKTGLALLYMLAICTERPDLVREKELHHCGAVIYVAGERGDAVRRRWAALLKRHSLTRADLTHEPLFVTSKEGVKIVESEDGRGGGRVVLTDQGREIMDRIEARGDVALVIYDTQSACFAGIPENANEAVGAAYVLLDTEAQRLNASFCVLHHMPKANGRTGGAGDMMSARGAGAGIAAVSNVITLTMLGRDENAKLPPGLRGHVFQLDGAKCNEAEWAKRRYFSRGSEAVATVNRKTGEPGKPANALVIRPEQLSFGWLPDAENNRAAVLHAVRERAQNGQPLRVKGRGDDKPAGCAVLAEQFGAKPDDLKQTLDSLSAEGLIETVDSEKVAHGRPHKLWAITAKGEAVLDTLADAIDY